MNTWAGKLRGWLSLAALLSFNAAATTFYVDANGTNPVSPYTSWDTAATNIQDAIRFTADGLHSGDTILVTNGVYQFGGQSASRVYLNNVSFPVTVKSVNGPDVTSIVGITNYNASQTRCVYLAGPHTLSGFTLTNGGAGYGSPTYGGGVYCNSQTAVITNCVLVGNFSSNSAAGAYSGTLINCVLNRNRAGGTGPGGGAYSSTLMNCIVSSNNASFAGGVYSCTLMNSLIVSNSASGGSGGGGAHSCVLSNCVLLRNIAVSSGGAYGCFLVNCLVVSNTASSSGGVGGLNSCGLLNCTLAYNAGQPSGSSFYMCKLTNCIAYYNSPDNGLPGITLYNSFYNCCTFPLPGTDTNNTAMPPLFVDAAHGDFRLASNSPCINTGNNLYVKSQFDLDGNPRIYGGTVDMGAYENQQVTQANTYTYYVNASNPAPVSPYLSWDTAATNIQDAVDIANAYSPIWVTNGVYAYGGGVHYDNGYMTNRVDVTKPLFVQSVNGPDSTIIMGYTGTNSAANRGIRCVYLVAGSMLSGFTLTNGATGYGDITNNACGGGVWCATNTIVVTNCVIAGNQGSVYGGGAFRGKYFNCRFENNSATPGSDGSGGGAAYAVLNNCVLSDNKVGIYPSDYGYGGAVFSCTLSNCFLSGNLAYGGGGSAESTLVGCTVVSNSASYAGGGDYHSKLNGCLVSSNSSPLGGGSYNSTMTNCVLSNNAAPNNNNGGGGGAYLGALTNCVLSGNLGYIGGGAREATLVGCVVSNNRAIVSGGGVHFSKLNGCLVSSNSSPIGGGARTGTLTNCVLSGNWATNGGGAADAVLLGCTISNNTAVFYGGGVYQSGLTNCTLKGNIASGGGSGGLGGGGSYNSTLVGCFLANNTAIALSSGGGSAGGALTACILSNNVADIRGGGAASALLTNCLVVFNSAQYGGGIANGSAVNATLINNSASQYGGGADESALFNSIVYYNSAPTDSNYYLGSLSYCCTLPDAGGMSFTNEPLLLNYVGNNFRLQSQSPCINAGNSSYMPTSKDLDGKTRIVRGTVDIGAYEYQTPASTLSYVWAQRFGLPTDGSADYADSDGDGSSNWLEWKSGTVPTNAASVLKMSSATNGVSGMVVTWQSVSGITYYLQRSSDLAGGFTSIASNLVGQAGSTSYPDTTATNAGPYFYRVGVP